MPNKLRFTCIGATLCCLLSGTAVAQERSGLPEVYNAPQRENLPQVNPRRIEADPNAPIQQALAQFGAWSQANGRPRILLFWNRELSDDTTTRYRDRTSGEVVSTAAPGIAVTSYDEVKERERTTGGRHARLNTDESADLESGFVSAFLRSGANIVDRNALMRKVSTRHVQEDRSDQQFVEAMALEQGVEYLVEVLPDYRNTATGLMFTVKITHLPTSQVKAQFRTNALPQAGPARLVARPGGYERERDSRNTPHHVSETLAADTMRRFF